jgi:plasmid stabilization system protein ParE
MGYAVKLSGRAERDLFDLFLYLKASNTASARRWFNELEKAICGLERSPRRCPPAPEAQTMNRPIRHLLSGRKPDVYRILYEIRDLTKTVLILTIRHGARDEWKPGKGI